MGSSSSYDDDLYTALEIRELVGLSQSEVADEIGIGQPHYSKLESGERRWTLKVSVAWLKLMLAKLDELPEGVVDFSRVLDFHDLDELNRGVN